jgi:hypothetical protein
MFTKYTIEMGSSGFTICATHNNGRLTGFEAATRTEKAEEIAAKFPKSVKMRVSDNHLGMRAYFISNEVTGSKNETSINRVRKFLATCDKLGLICRFDHVHCLNQILSREEFEAQLS